MGGHGSAGLAVAVRGAAAAAGSQKRKLSPRKLLMQKKAQQVAEEASVSLLYHCSGVTCRQWQELKNHLAPIQGKVLFQPNYKGYLGGAPPAPAASAFVSRVASAPGPLCLLYLGPGTAQDKLAKLLPPSSMSSNMLLLFGQQQSTLLNHLDIKKAAGLDLTSVYRRSVFSTLFHPMSFFSGLDRLKAAGAASESASTNADGGQGAPGTAPAQ